MKKSFIRIFKVLLYSILIVFTIMINCSFAYAAENGPSDIYGSIYIDTGNDAGYIYYNSNKIYKCKTFSGIEYNRDNNTLYLNNTYIQNELKINCMGDDFKIEVSGTNHIGQINATTCKGMWPCNLNIIGDGELIINEQKVFYSAIYISGYGNTSNISIGENIKAKLYASEDSSVLHQTFNKVNPKAEVINIVPEVTDGASISENDFIEFHTQQTLYCDFTTKYTFYGLYSKENDSNLYVSFYEEDYKKDKTNIYKIEYDTFVNEYVAILVEQGNPYKLGYKQTVSPSEKDYIDDIFLANEETSFTKCIKDNKEYWAKGGDLGDIYYYHYDYDATICELVYDTYLNKYIAVEKEKVSSFYGSGYRAIEIDLNSAHFASYSIRNNYLEIGYHTHTLTKTDIVKATFTSDGYTEEEYCTNCKYYAKRKRKIPRIKTVQISNTTQKYTGETIKPMIYVSDSEGNTLKYGRDYYIDSKGINVGTYTGKVIFKGNYRGEKEYKYTITKGVLSNSWALICQNVSQGIKLNWYGLPKAAKYIIRRRTSSSNFKVIKIINNNKVSKYIDTSVKNNNGKAYYYEIEAIKDSNYQERKAKHFCIRLLKPNVNVSKKKDSLVVKWNKNKNANGYEVMLVCGNSKKIYSTKNLSKTFKLKKGKNYKIYVKCYYKNCRDEYYYSEWSKGKSIRF